MNKNRLTNARSCYETDSLDAFASYAGALNPTYITLGRGAHRERFINDVPAKNHCSICDNLRGRTRNSTAADLWGGALGFSPVDERRLLLLQVIRGFNFFHWVF